jgi:beta-lactamase class A
MESYKKSRLKTKRRLPNPLVIPLLYLLRFLILGVGLGAIAGTVLSMVEPLPLLKAKPQPQNSPAPSSPNTTPVVAQDLMPLRQKLQTLGAKYPKIQGGAFFIDLDNGNYVNWQGDTVFSAASTIKVPILVAFFQAVDAGKIKLDELLTLEKDTLASGSGNMQYEPLGKKFTALETARRMIVISDNSATNMLIKRLGGKDFLNQTFQQWGLSHTVLYDLLPDLAGKNTTSPQDLVQVLSQVNQGQLLSVRSRDRMLMIMRETETRTLLPQGLEKGAIIAHKTGDIRTALGDVGLIDMPNGKQYIGAVLVKRPDNDPQARTFIQGISRTVYQHFKWYGGGKIKQAVAGNKISNLAPD